MIFLPELLFTWFCLFVGQALYSATIQSSNIIGDGTVHLIVTESKRRDMTRIFIKTFTGKVGDKVWNKLVTLSLSLSLSHRHTNTSKNRIKM